MYNLQQKNHCCILIDSSICIIENILKYNINDFRLVIRKFNIVNALYNVDNLDSRKIGIFKCSGLTEESKEISIKEVKCKGYKMPFWQNSEQFCVKDTYVVAELCNNEWLH